MLESISQDQPRPAKVAPSWAETEMITDRPDQTESSITVPHKTLQIETGFVFESYSTESVDFQDWGIGTTLLRYGLLPNLELRLGSFYQYSELEFGNAMDSTQQGIGPVTGGLKVFIADEDGWRPQLSLLADITLSDAGENYFRPSYSYTTIKILASHTLSETLGLGYNLGYANNGEDPGGMFVYSLVLGASLTNRLSAFAEVYGTFDDRELPRHRIDGGFTFLLMNNLQLDVSAGLGPEDDGVSMWFGNAGVSWRIPR